MAEIFTGGKRETNTQGGNYFEQVENVILPQRPGVDARFQLPAAPGDFTGRAAELNELRAAVAGGAAAIFGLRGQGGVGKTALALVLAHELAPRYPDAQIYLDLQGTAAPLTPGDVMRHVILAFHPNAQPPADDAGLAGAYHSVLAGQRALLLYDNAHDAAQVQPLLPPPGCLLLITSRQRFALPGLRPLSLGSLPRADAIRLLLAIAPRIGEQADALAALCGDLPLALRLAGGALDVRDDLTPASYAAKLKTDQGRRAELEPALASLALSYNLLDAGLQAAWRALAVFAGGFFAFSAAAVLGVEQDAAGDRLGGLRRYSLLDYDPDLNRYRLHDLARDAAGARLEGDERLSAERRHAAHYGDALSAADDLYLEGGAKVLAGLRLFDLERLNIEAGQRWAAARAESDDGAARLCSDYAGQGNHVRALRQHPRDQIAWMEAALTAARRLGDRSAEGIHLGNLGNAYADLGEPRRAIEFYEQHRDIARAIGDRRGEGNALGNLGNAYAALGETRRAIEFYEQALVIDREIGDRRGEGIALWNMSLALDKLGERADAIANAEAALRIREQIEDPNAEMVRRALAEWQGGGGRGL